MNLNFVWRPKPKQRKRQLSPPLKKDGLLHEIRLGSVFFMDFGYDDAGRLDWREDEIAGTVL